jgi:hypothetical protein
MVSDLKKNIKHKLPANYNNLSRSERREVRNRYVEIQKGKCFWCGEKLTGDPPKIITDKKIDWNLFPDGFLNFPIHLQHDHKTGLTEGAVHAFCNAYMWQYENR